MSGANSDALPRYGDAQHRFSRFPLLIVITGLDPVILDQHSAAIDHRVKPGDDECRDAPTRLAYR